MTILVGKETMFFLASLGAVMQLKCGSAALGIANHFNSLNAEDEMLALRILGGSAKISAHSPWKPLPLIRFFSVPLPSADTAKYCGVIESCTHLARVSLEASASRRGTKVDWEVKLLSSRGTGAEQWSPAVP